MRCACRRSWQPGTDQGIRIELAVDLVLGSWPDRIGNRGRHVSPRDPLQSLLSHEPLHGAPGGSAVLPAQFAPDLARSEPPFACIVNALDCLEGFGVPFGPVGGFSGIAGEGDMRLSGRRSDRQDAADRFDSVGLAMLFNEEGHLRNGAVELCLGKTGRRLLQDLVGGA